MRPIVAATAALLLMSLPAAADEHAATGSSLEPQEQNGVQFVSGGVGVQERADLLALEDDYTLRIATTRADDAYLAGVEITIENGAGETLVQTTTAGPILLAKLEPGRYVVHAADEGRETERRVVDVPREDDMVRLYISLPDA